MALNDTTNTYTSLKLFKSYYTSVQLIIAAICVVISILAGFLKELRTQY